MQLVSTDDTVPGVFAFGGAPVGIVAVGAMPVGVLAIGICAAGVVSVSCGAGAGGVTVTCGVGVGGAAYGIGLGIGLRAAFVGLGLSVLERVSKALPPVPGPSRFDWRAGQSAVPIERLTSGELAEGWAVLEAERGPGGTWTLVLDGAPVELASPALRAELRRLTPVDPRVFAHFVTVERPDAAAPGGDYRTAAATKRVLVCDRVVTDGKEPGPPEAREVTRLDAVGAVWKGALFLAAMAGATVLVRDRFADLELDRKREVSFTARVVQTTRADVPEGEACTVRAWLRTDGRTRRKVAAEVACGAVVLYPRSAERAVAFEERPVPGRSDEHTYRMEYVDPGSRPSGDDSGSPAFVFQSGTGNAVVESWDDPAFRVELAADPESAPSRGAPLLEESRAAQRPEPAVPARER